jgi:outer membrane protein assembly factor BamE (lipoprotein component of BamABCDE complex)
MFKRIFFTLIILTLASCSTSNKYSKDIPMYLLSIGMTKEQVVSKLGQPHRVVGSEILNNNVVDTWMYEKNEAVWLTGNAFLGGRVRNDRTIYLLEFSNDQLTRWKDNAMQKETKPDNTYEIRNK